MIPIHPPPFGLAVLVRAAFGRRPTLREVEEAYAAGCGIAHAVWLPSARAGIAWSLQAVAEPRVAVACPAYTCKVVHEAVIRAGLPMRLVDVGPEGFLADGAALVGEGGAAVVLCELFGHTYDLAHLATRTPSPPRLRVVDMATMVPLPEVVGRLSGNDFAVISFGIGKSMYAGWGGMGLTRDGALAAEVRARRDKAVQPGGAPLALRRGLVMALRTAVQHRALYREAKDTALAVGWLRRRIHGVEPAADLPDRWAEGRGLDAEWFAPATKLDLALIVRNLAWASEFSRRRLALAERYRAALDGARGVVLPPASPYALSHFTVRVPPDARPVLVRALWRAGVDVGILYEFPDYLDREAFPNAARIGSEVVNLPLSVDLSDADVGRIADVVRRVGAGVRPSRAVPAGSCR
jgi:dTDP-4-amino-4,6-dideoxygalactose transaminase